MFDSLEDILTQMNPPYFSVNIEMWLPQAIFLGFIINQEGVVRDKV